MLENVIMTQQVTTKTPVPTTRTCTIRPLQRPSWMLMGMLLTTAAPRRQPWVKRCTQPTPHQKEPQTTQNLPQTLQITLNLQQVHRSTMFLCSMVVWRTRRTSVVLERQLWGCTPMQTIHQHLQCKINKELFYNNNTFKKENAILLKLMPPFRNAPPTLPLSLVRCDQRCGSPHRGQVEDQPSA